MDAGRRQPPGARCGAGRQRLARASCGPGRSDGGATERMRVFSIQFSVFRGPGRQRLLGEPLTVGNRVPLITEHLVLKTSPALAAVTLVTVAAGILSQALA